MEFRIKEICREKGVLIKDLAASIGVTDIALRQSLKGNPTTGTLEKIATALQVSVTELFEQPQEGVIACPHCGKWITLKAEQ